MAHEKQRLVSAKELAEHLGVNERTVRRWCQRHEVRAVLLPGDRLWRVYVNEHGEPVRA